MGMGSRVVPTSGGWKAQHENSSLEQVQALVKRFYGLKPATSQQVSTCLNRCHEISRELAGIEAECTIISLHGRILGAIELIHMTERLRPR